MDLFKVFPQLVDQDLPALKARSLRLISLAGLVYDARVFYFALSEPRLWGRLPNGEVSIGVGAAKVRPEGATPPLQQLRQHLRQQWRCEVDLFSVGHAYVLDEQHQVSVLSPVPTSSPYLWILTPPRLGGVKMPDALVQAVYLLPLRRWERARQALLAVRREALAEFLAADDWPEAALRAYPWATFHLDAPLPEGARLRPVLALRGLQHLLRAGLLPGDGQLQPAEGAAS